MSNDLGGAAKQLWAAVAGTEEQALQNPGALDDLRTKDAAGTYEFSANHVPFTILNGQIAYDVNSIKTHLNSLGVNETWKDTITYSIRLANGTLSMATLFISINGSNDGIVIGAKNVVGDVTEDGATNGLGQLTDLGSIAFTDADLNDSHTTSVGGVTGSELGALTAVVTEASGAAGGTVDWNYAIDNAKTQYLAKGETLVEKFDIAITDGNGSTVTERVSVTVTGVNDEVTIVDASTTATGALTEDTGSTLTASGSIAFTDVDLSDLHTATFAPNASNTLGGTLVLGAASEAANAAGGTVGWTYSIDNALVQSLGKDEVKTESFTVTINDGNGDTVEQVVTVTVTGVNDTAVISGEVSGVVTEDTAPNPISGNLTVLDADAGESTFKAANGSTTYGDFTVDAAGHWTYTLNNALPLVQALNNGGTLPDSFVVQSADGTPQTVNITINGVTDVTVPVDLGGPTGIVFVIEQTGNSPTLGHFQAVGDPDDTVFTYAATTPTDVTVDTAGILTAPLGTNGNVVVTATDDAGHSTTSTFNLVAGANGNINDTIDGTAGSDILAGFNGTDTLSGSNGVDYLLGGSQDDKLNGGLGNDVLVGGGNNDVFILDNLGAADADLIVDLASGDRVDLSALLAGGASTTDANIGTFVDYNAANGQLTVDVDGAGGANTPQLVATVYSNYAAGTFATSVNILFDADNTLDHNLSTANIT